MSYLTGFRNFVRFALFFFFFFFLVSSFSLCFERAAVYDLDVSLTF